MRAVQYMAPGKAALVSAPDPEAGPGEMLLRPTLVAICGSDLHFLHDGPVASYPAKPGFSGHECVATVADCAQVPGPGLHRGARVLALAPDYDAFAELLVARPETVIPVPDAVATEQALMAQQLGTVLFCCRKLPNVMDRHVAVVGQGPAGLLFTMVLRKMGAATITGLDIVDHRLGLARRLGADVAVHSGRTNPVEAVRAITGGAMADIVIEAVGKAETINLCADLVRNAGDVMVFGMPKRDKIPLRLEAFMRKNVRMLTGVFAQREPGLRSFRLALAWIASGHLDPVPLITHRLRFAEAARGFELALTKAEQSVKVLLNL